MRVCWQSADRELTGMSYWFLVWCFHEDTVILCSASYQHFGKKKNVPKSKAAIRFIHYLGLHFFSVLRCKTNIMFLFLIFYFCTSIYGEYMKRSSSYYNSPLFFFYNDHLLDLWHQALDWNFKNGCVQLKQRRLNEFTMHVGTYGTYTGGCVDTMEGWWNLGLALIYLGYRLHGSVDFGSVVTRVDAVGAASGYRQILGMTAVVLLADLRTAFSLPPCFGRDRGD